MSGVAVRRLLSARHERWGVKKRQNPTERAAAKEGATAGAVARWCSSKVSGELISEAKLQPRIDPLGPKAGIVEPERRPGWPHGRAAKTKHGDAVGDRELARGGLS